MNDQLKVRREKMDELREEGIDPFGHRFERTDLAQDLQDKYGDMDKDELDAKQVVATIAGRMLAKRGKGKVGFADIWDRSGKMQSAKILTISSSVLILVISLELPAKFLRRTLAN